MAKRLGRPKVAAKVKRSVRVVFYLTPGEAKSRPPTGESLNAFARRVFLREAGR